MQKAIVFLFLIVFLSCGLLFSAQFDKLIELFKESSTVVEESDFRQAKSDFLNEFNELLQQSIPYQTSGDWAEEFEPNDGLILANGYYDLQIGEEDGVNYYSIAGLGNKTWDEKVCFIWGAYDPDENAMVFISDEGTGPEPVVNIIELSDLFGGEDSSEDEPEEESYSDQAQAALSTLRKVYDVYLQTNGSLEGLTTEMAINDARLGSSTLTNWTFEMYSEANLNYPRILLAISTEACPAGEGLRVWYDINEAKFHGYQIDEQPEPRLNNLKKMK